MSSLLIDMRSIATAFDHCGKPVFLGCPSGTSQQNSFPSVLIESIRDCISNNRKKPKVWHQLAVREMVRAGGNSVAQFFSN